MTLNPWTIDLVEPINWQNPLNRGLEAWWITLPHRRGLTWHELRRRHPGTLTNTPTWAGSSGRRGGFGSLNFTGATQYVDVPTLANVFGGRPQATISLWLKPNVIGSNAYLTDVGGFCFQIQTSASPFNRIFCNIRDGVSGGLTPVLETGNDGIVNDVWNHVIVSIDGTNDSHKLWVNGVEKASSTAAFTVFDADADSHFRLGHASASQIGQRDSYRLYFRPFTAAEAMALYLEEAAGYPRTLNRERRVTWFAPAGGDTFTASVAATIGAATASVSATHTTPTYTATVSASVGPATAAVSATHTTPTYTATVAASVGAATAAASAEHTTPTYTATVAADIGAATASVSAEHTTPTYTATVSATVGAPTASASAEHTTPTYTASIAATVGGATASVSATFGASDTYTATIAATIGAATASIAALYFRSLSVHQTCLEGVYADILTLGLTGLSSTNVLLKKIPRDQNLPEATGLIVSLLPGAGEVKMPQYSTNERVAYGYPVMVTGWSVENQDNEIDSDSDQQLLRRETILRRYDEQRLSGVPGVHFCRVQPLTILDVGDFLGANLWSWALRIDCVTRLERV